MPGPTTATQCMKSARLLTSFLARYGHPNQVKVAQIARRALLSSQEVPGAPALRFADAMTACHVRLTFPRLNDWEVREEQVFAHLYHAIRDPAKAHYRVWYAIEAFTKQRISLFGPPLLFDPGLPSLPDYDREYIRVMVKLARLAEDTKQEWATRLFNQAGKIEPNPSMLTWLQRLTAMLTHQQDPEAQRAAGTEFWANYNRIQWVRDSPIGGLVALVPSWYYQQRLPTPQAGGVTQGAQRPYNGIK